MKTCAICGAEFEATRSNQKYCSRAECKRERKRRYLNAWRRANRKAVNLQSVMKCEICGAEFEATRSNQKYCSRAECKREGLRRWRRANRKALKLQEEFHDLGKPISIARARQLVSEE